MFRVRKHLHDLSSFGSSSKQVEEISISHLKSWTTASFHDSLLFAFDHIFIVCQCSHVKLSNGGLSVAGLMQNLIIVPHLNANIAPQPSLLGLSEHPLKQPELHQGAYNSECLIND